MIAQPGDIAVVAVAALQIAGVLVERLANADRSVASTAVAGNGARLVLCLPKVEDVCSFSILVIVGNAESLDPCSATTVGDLGAPTTGAFVAAIAERDSWRDGDVIRLAPRREFKPGGAGFDLR